jgi:anti-sigma regulatory factor (Ser/Thr protein kinase)
MNRVTEKTIRLPARLENLEKLIDFAIRVLRKGGVGERTVSDLHLAVDEACTNCCSYAYPDDESGEIELACRIDPEEISITIRDWGRPFNPLENPPPDLTLDLDDRPIGGLGIFLLKKFADRVDYRREKGANVLTIVKKR